MAAFTDYRGLKRWIPAPTGPAGIVLNDNFTELADRAGPIHSAAANPTVNDDEVDTAGNGKFYLWSKWLNTGTNDLYICIDSTATAAVWNRIHYNNITDPDINNSMTIDSTQVLFLPAQASFNGTLIVGDGGTNLVHNAGAEGKFNIAVGRDALKSVTTGDSNVAVGDSALDDVTTGIRNLALGYEAQNKCISGQYNVAVGDEVLYTNTIGNRNVCIGTRAGHAILGDDNVCIGHHAGENEIGSDKLYIDCTDTATPLIYGEFDNDLVKINGDLYIPSDTKKLFFGAGNDATIGFDNNSLNIIANVVTAADDLELTGQTIQMNGLLLTTDKVMFTQIDGNEYIDSLNDGFIDYGATTAHRFLAPIKITADSRKLYFGAADDSYIEFDGDSMNIVANTVTGTDDLELTGQIIQMNGLTLATDKVMFTQVDGNEYIDSLNDGFIDYGATTAHRFLNDVKITQDNDKLYFGVADDVSITYTGTSWIFDIETATATISMNPDGDDTDFVFGSSQLDDTGVAAQDRRMFFDKGKGAFRAGRVDSTQWNAANVGDNSIALGKLPTASGDCAVCLAAYGIASGAYSVTTGLAAIANKHGQSAHSGGNHAAGGDAQGSTFIVRKSVVHSDAAWYELFLNGSSDQLTLASNTVWTFSVLIVGTTNGCTKSFGFKIEGVIENDGGTTTILASNVTTLYDADDTDFDARVTADDATDALSIEVTDATSGGDTVRWVCKVNTVEVTF